LESRFREPGLCADLRAWGESGRWREVFVAQQLGGTANLPGISWALGVRGGRSGRC